MTKIAPVSAFVAGRPLREHVLRAYSWLAIALLLSAGLNGCASYHPRPLSTPANATAFSKHSFDSGGLRAFMQTQLGQSVTPWPLHRWTLDQLTLAALHYHPKLALARAQWARARAKAITAGAYPNPTLQFLPQYATNPGALSPRIIGLSVNVPIVTAGKRAYAFRGQSLTLYFFNRPAMVPPSFDFPNVVVVSCTENRIS